MTIIDEINTIFKEVDKLLIDEACSKCESEKRDLIQQGLEKASRLLEIAPDYHNTYHLLGLLWYHHPDKDSKRSQSIKAFLNRAIELAPNEGQFSVQYLGYIHFDEADYAEALKWFEQTDENYFERDDKRWRWLKARELALVCRGRIRGRVDLEEARLLASEYVRAEQDGHSPPLPTEISEFARESKDKNLEDSETFASIVVAMLSKLDLAFMVERFHLIQEAEQAADGKTPQAP